MFDNIMSPGLNSSA